jgi:hypothetical protein
MEGLEHIPIITRQTAESIREVLDPMMSERVVA